MLRGGLFDNSVFIFFTYRFTKKMKGSKKGIHEDHFEDIIADYEN